MSNRATNSPSGLNQYANPNRMIIRRKNKSIKRKRRPYINLPSFSHLIENQYRHRFIKTPDNNLSTELSEYTLALRWLADHGQEYAGKWVALNGNQLLSYGENARVVYEAVRQSGIMLPLVVRVNPVEELPFGGW